MKTQGQSPLDPWAIFASPYLQFGHSGLTTRQGEGRAKPDSLARPSQPPELIEKTWSPGLSRAPLADPSIPQFHYPPWPGVHFIKHAIVHSNSCVDKAGQTVVWPHGDKKCNPNNLVHSKFMYLLNQSYFRKSYPALRWIYHSFAGPITLEDITWYWLHNICSVIYNVTIADRFNVCHLLDKSILKVIWQFVSARSKRKKTAKANISRQSRKQGDGVREWSWVLGETGCQVFLSSSTCLLQTRENWKGLLRECPKRSIPPEGPGDTGR